MGVAWVGFVPGAGPSPTSRQRQRHATNSSESRREEAKTLRALITGIAGFAGSHLADYLLARGGIDVHGIVRPAHSTHNIDHIRTRLALHATDLGDYRRVRELLSSIRPDYVFHLAAQASTKRSWEDPRETLITNITIQLSLLQAIVDANLGPRVLIVGSADEYGLVGEEDLPIDEGTPMRPLSPYAVSKIAQDYLGYQYHLSYGLDVVRVRPFNHIGPRQRLGFVVPDFASRIALIEAGLEEPVLQVGNLAAHRDFTDVRDIARAYYLALAKGVAGEVYNVGSSSCYAIREVLDRLLEMSRVSVKVEVDPDRMRPSDVPTRVCDPRRFQADTGWEPELDLARSLRDTLDYWRDRVGTG